MARPTQILATTEQLLDMLPSKLGHVDKRVVEGHLRLLKEPEKAETSSDVATAPEGVQQQQIAPMELNTGSSCMKETSGLFRDLPETLSKARQLVHAVTCTSPPTRALRAERLPCAFGRATRRAHVSGLVWSKSK